MNRAKVALRAVAVLVLLAWRRAAASGGAAVPGIVAGLVVVAVVVGVFWLTSQRADTARRQVVAARPGWLTQAVWADTSLGAEIGRLTGGTSVSLRGGTRMTLAWSPSHVQLWRGEAVVASVPWEQVRDVTRTVGNAASTGNPAVELTTQEGARLVVVPTRRPDVGMLPAGAAQVDGLVGRLRAARERLTA